jgi:protoporphyrinogen oxidase
MLGFTNRTASMARKKRRKSPAHCFWPPRVSRVYSSFFEPLLISKFGDQMDRVSAAWLVSRIAIRSNRGLSGERLGYLRGGFQDLVHALADAIGRHCTVRLNDPVTSLARDPHGWRVNGQLYDRVLSTIPPQSLVEAGGPAFAPVPYQGAACMLLAMDREVTDGLYWLNMKDRAPYGAVITHTNFAPLERYGEHLVYLASYFLGKMPERLDQLMLRDFCTRFEVREGEIHWRRMAVEPWAGPVFVTGYRDLIPAYQEKGLYMAGMFSFPNYPERSMEGAVVAGQEAAALIDRGGQA